MRPRAQRAHDVQHCEGQLEEVDRDDCCAEAEDKDEPDRKVNCCDGPQQHAYDDGDVKHKPYGRVADAQD
eukprot:CAMPEP_0173105436 /NCGR_PEP_ID=MMETSP1102-20130122/40103_1 /TAXON_ID=49646 /ORGANISM="Geminigera sp., Strain Caron Lab Isolate" /LENGTH=69 /DNA_ID=CAMNT_0014001679 /DNA_START=324 /DNA_END=533 /DNA_ORIENTATION=+